MSGLHFFGALILLFLVIVIYRRSVVRKAGEAVGRAKARLHSDKPKPLAKTDGVSRDLGVLDLKPGANFGEVKSAYRELAKVWHPDRFGSDAKLRERANVKLGEINAAYERLKNHFGK